LHFLDEKGPVQKRGRGRYRGRRGYGYRRGGYRPQSQEEREEYLEQQQGNVEETNGEQTTVPRRGRGGYRRNYRRRGRGRGGNSNIQNEGEEHPTEAENAHPTSEPAPI